MHGRFGAYVQLGETPDKSDKAAPKPKRASLTGGMTESTVTLDDALRLLSLPRELGRHPDDGEPVVAGLGRFGPYVKHGDEFRSLESEDDVFTRRSRARAGAARASRRSRGAGRRADATVLRAARTHPRAARALQVLEGRYGPYVTDGDDQRVAAERHGSRTR